MGSKGHRWSKHKHSYRGRQRMYYVFRVLMDARIGNDGQNQGFTPEMLALLVARLAGVDDKIDFKRETTNMGVCLRIYRSYGYLRKVKGGRWIFDWYNWKNIRAQRNGSPKNRIEWKYEKLQAEALEQNWPVNPEYMEA